MKELLLRVTIKDCGVQTFRSGGPGGQHQNKTSSGVRVIHPPSGAVGESREQRSQFDNKVSAFKKMANSTRFQLWLKRESFERLGQESPEVVVERMMKPENLKVEGKQNGKWVPLKEEEITDGCGIDL
jgi:protein subunit release factor B